MISSLQSKSHLQPSSGLVRQVARVPWKVILQRVPGTWYIMFLFLMVLGPAYTPILFSLVYLSLHVFFILNNVRSFWGTFVGYRLTVQHSKTDWESKYQKLADGFLDDGIIHTIIIPNYKEGLDTLCETLDVLASHQVALQRYRVCLAMEASEKEAQIKAHTLLTKYQDSFLEITYTIHPAGRPGEAKGKAANVSWAAREMIRLSNGPCSNEILTVMDADTCFAQDYFSAISYYYAAATPETRKLMMFVPPTIFDRNANQVPTIVRVTDMLWSAGVMSNLYPSSPIKIPCSAYSLPCTLAHAVDYWDTDVASMGEDMHMYLKCFFATQGRIQVQVIHSPASQCNVQGDGFWNGVIDRYNQGIRHMWGCLDSAYVIRRSIFGFLSPGHDSTHGQLLTVPMVKTSESISPLSLPTMIHLWHRILESHIVMGQVFLSLILTSMVIPVPGAASFAPAIWSMITTEAVHPYVAYATMIGGYVRMFSVIPFIAMIYYYEKYQQWNGTDRWLLSLQEQIYPGTGQSVKVLGRRATLVSPRTLWNLFDWLVLPLTGFFYLSMPQLQAQMCHLISENMEYKVAGKPSLSNANRVSEVEPLVGIEVVDLQGQSQEASVPDSSNCDSESVHSDASSLPAKSRLKAVSSMEDVKSIGSSRGDSGYFEFDDSQMENTESSPAFYSPSMWRAHSTRSHLSWSAPHA